jgi:tyrosyl-tRNA synthetase
MSKKTFSGGFDSLLGDNEKPKRGRPKTQTKKVEKSSEEGTKEDETRATFIVNKEVLSKIKAISKLEGFQYKDTVNEALTRFIKEYEKKKGSIKDPEAIINRDSIL